MTSPIPSEDRRLVWDLPVRLFHWLLVVSTVASWSTAKMGFAWMKWHFWFGYWFIGLLVFRLIWGVVGPRHARFCNFLKGPSKVLEYVRSLAGTAEIERSVGHNPLGGLMVVLMLGLLIVQVSTGLFATDDIAWAGPYNAAVSATAAGRLTSLHHANFKIISCAIGLHLVAIFYYTRIRKEALVAAMVTGKKPAGVMYPGQTISGSQLWKALGVFVLCCGIVYLILREAPLPGAAK